MFFFYYLAEREKFSRLCGILHCLLADIKNYNQHSIYIYQNMVLFYGSDENVTESIKCLKELYLVVNHDRRERAAAAARAATPRATATSSAHAPAGGRATPHTPTHYCLHAPIVNKSLYSI